MFKHKVFDLLMSLTPEEFKRLGDFVSSSYFNKSKNVTAIYKYILPYYPEFNNKNLSRFKVYEKLFRSKNYKDSSIRNVLAKLVNVTEMFLVIESLKSDKPSQNNLLLEELNRRKLNELFTKNLKDAEAELSGSGQVDFDYLLNRYKLERNKFNFSMQYDKIISKKKVYTQIWKLSDAGIYLSIYYITELISENINVVVYNEKFNFEEELPSTISLILDCVDYVRIYASIRDKFQCDFILEIYIALLSAFRSLDNDQAYYDYKALIDKYKSRLSSDEISFHYSIMLGCCILKTKLRKSPALYDKELMSLYDDILRNEYYKNKKVQHLPEDLYRDILFLRIRAGRLELVKELIDKYSGQIHFLQRNNMYNFSSAFYYFGLKKYEKSMEYLNRIRLDYFIYKYDVKNLLLKVYFELGYYEEAISLIHSYRELLRKDTFFNEHRKTRNKNFIKFLRRLIVLKIDNRLEEIENIRFDLEALSEVRSKKWLLEKISGSTKKGMVMAS